MLELNHYIFLFLTMGLLLHWWRRSFSHAITNAAPSVAGVLIEYPLYAGIVPIMTESGLATPHCALFHLGLHGALVSHFDWGVFGVLGIVRALRGKWLVEAPYVLDAAKTLHVHLGWVVQTYNATESLANLIHPFWMLPLLGMLGCPIRAQLTAKGIKASLDTCAQRDIMCLAMCTGWSF